MKNDAKQRDILSILLLIGTVTYFISILWINFHARQWYSFDIYSDSFLARIMVEQETIFPDNWVFGNQYYVVATPTLAAAIYALCHNSVLALAVASSIMMILVLSIYLWAVGPFIQKREKLAGLFCLSGAIVLGNSASSYVNGLEYFYTMASFYACYIFAILFTLGVYFRLRAKKNANLVVIIISLFLSFALGMQSLRGTLVLYLPLLAYAFLMSVIQRNEKNSMIFSILLLVVNFAGVVVMKFIPVKSAPIISEISLTLNLSNLISNLKTTSIEFLTITGLRFCTYGLKWLPLFLTSVFFFTIVILAIVGIIKNKKGSIIEGTIIISVISVLAVFVVGVFLFRVRAIYFFVWYLLVVFCFIYDIKEYRNFSRSIIAILCLAGVVNYITNFYPDFSEYKCREAFYQKVTDELLSEGVDCVYYDLHTSPLLAVYSNDQIISGTVHLDPTEESGGLMYPVNYLKPTDVFKNADQYNAYIVFSNWTFDYLERSASDEYIKKLMSNLEYIKKYSCQNEELTLYKFSSEILNYSK